MIRYADLPPIWLVGFLGLVWLVDMFLPGQSVLFAGQRALAAVLFVVGVLLMVLAAVEMARARTTIIPHRQPAALVPSGIFRFSRNPIYLGDVLVLASGILWTGAVVALPLLWFFMRITERRFIVPEEERLKSAFGEDFSAWAETTRRWL